MNSLLTNFDPHLKITDDKFSDALFSLLISMFSEIKLIRIKLIELSSRVDFSTSGEHPSDECEAYLDRLFNEIYTELLVRHGE
jgi:hypothetical protein